mgnify:CR=1 FL=1
MKRVLHTYLNHFEKLEYNRIEMLLNTIDSNFIFEDPFQKIKGKDDFRILLEKMFKKLKKPKFLILKIYEDNLVNIVKWKFTCEIFKKNISFYGVSEIYIKNNLVSKHIDYWDSGRNFYSELPFLGHIFKMFHK